MRGSIRQRSPGHFAIILEQSDAATGKRKRKWHSFKGTKRQAQIECARLISELNGGTYLEPSKITMAQHLERWLEHVRSQISPRTYERYCEIVRKNIIPALGAIYLTKLRPAQISEAYAKALASGRRDGKGGLAPTTVVYLHRLIRKALGQAVRWELLSRNVADAVDPPKIERNVLPTYDMAQTAELLEAATRDTIAVAGAVGGDVWATARRDHRASVAQYRLCGWPDVGGGKRRTDRRRSAVQITKVGQGTHHSVVGDGCFRIAPASSKSSPRASQAGCEADQCHLRLYPSGRRADAAAQSVADVGFLLHASPSHSISRP
jgi:hypothetical protein